MLTFATNVKLDPHCQMQMVHLIKTTKPEVDSTWAFFRFTLRDEEYQSRRTHPGHTDTITQLNLLVENLAHFRKLQLSQNLELSDPHFHFLRAHSD